MPGKTTGRDGGDRSTRKDYKHTSNRSTGYSRPVAPFRALLSAALVRWARGGRQCRAPVLCHRWRHRT